MAQTHTPGTLQPTHTDNRMVWMAWEDLWRQSAEKKDPGLLAQLIGSGIDTPEKKDAAQIVFNVWAIDAKKYSGKLMRLLLKNGAAIDPFLIAPLCVCGPKAIELMIKYDADIKQTNIAGQNALALICMSSNNKEFIHSWKLLRKAGLDPDALDTTLETAWDAARQYGKENLAHEAEDLFQSDQTHRMIDRATPGIIAPGHKRKRL